MKQKLIPILGLALPLLLPLSGSGAELGTRQRTICPIALPTNTPVIYPSDVADYAVYGYSSWQWGPGEDEGQQLTNMPAGYPGATNAATLLSFACLSDAHITDKESPAQAIAISYQGGKGVNPSTYSPVMLSTSQVLNDAVKTINGLNRLMPFDFAISLGDDANGPQYNELRWFIDVMDGKPITPSSGTNAGAATIDYQKPFRAAGLDPAIPWYAVIGNHDHFWMGGFPIAAFQSAFTNTDIIQYQGAFMGTIDGSTPYGNIIGVGPVTNFIVGGVTNTPTVAADPNRYALTTSNWMREFFTTTSQPVGHGFNLDNITNDFACYSFVPKASVPIKVIVFDDTMTDADFVPNGQGTIDTNHFNWLVQELDQGQAQNQLMIIAAHIPLQLVGANSPISNSNLLATLHSYPNLLLWICGHVHVNDIIPQPSPDTNHPEYGFWEVETASLRDFPQEFRTFEILRNTDNSISIRVTDIDPEETPGSPADVSRGYAVGAARIFMTPCSSVTDTNSYAHNAELLKLLPAAMQTNIANYGGPLGHHLAVDCAGTGVTINFLGELQSAETLNGPWSDVTNTSPYAVPATNAANFYRAYESGNSPSAAIATDYSIAGHWLALPTNTVAGVDVFYLYPTAWQDTNSDPNPRICAIDNPSMLTGAASAYARQATVFNGVGNIYAPYYRQDNMSASNREAVIAGIPTLDATAAFDYYIQHLNMGRPFVLAGHSQGSDVLSNLLSDYMKAHPEVLSRMIAAYVLGFSITPEYMSNNPHLKFATGPDDTGVIISYNTEAPDVAIGANPVLSTTGIGLVINPISWSTDEVLVLTNDVRNLGTSIPQFLPYADAQIDKAKGVLVCAAANEDVMHSLTPGMPRGVYHSFDYLFYYYNLRANATNRVAKFLAAHP